MKSNPRVGGSWLLASVFVLLCVVNMAQGYLPVYVVYPGYESVYNPKVNDAGTLIVGGWDFYASEVRMGRWDSSGAPFAEFKGIFDGTGSEDFYALNNSGVVVGSAAKVEDFGGGFIVDEGYRAARWQSGSLVPTELGNLGTDANGVTNASAYDVNDLGTAVGFADKYVSGINKGNRAVRWNAGGTAGTELGNLGTNATGNTTVQAYDINESNTAVGQAHKYSAAGVDMGNRAVRWDASSTVAIELTFPAGNYRNSGASAINEAGTMIGSASLYDGSGIFLEGNVVRWDASGAVVTVLDNPFTNPTGQKQAAANAINDAGTAVGYAYRPDWAGRLLDIQAMRWDGSGNAATVLNGEGTDADGISHSEAQDINNAGIVVGWAERYDEFHNLISEEAGVYWKPNGQVVYLNDLIEPALGINLGSAYDITDTGWIAGGMGDFVYYGSYLIQIPEPGAGGVFLFGAAVSCWRRPKR